MSVLFVMTATKPGSFMTSHRINLIDKIMRECSSLPVQTNLLLWMLNTHAFLQIRTTIEKWNTGFSCNSRKISLSVPGGPTIKTPFGILAPKGISLGSPERYKFHKLFFSTSNIRKVMLLVVYISAAFPKFMTCLRFEFDS